jgi:hypothetical protein
MAVAKDVGIGVSAWPGSLTNKKAADARGLAQMKCSELSFRLTNVAQIGDVAAREFICVNLRSSAASPPRITFRAPAAARTW